MTDWLDGLIADAVRRPRDVLLRLERVFQQSAADIRARTVRRDNEIGLLVCVRPETIEHDYSGMSCPRHLNTIAYTRADLPADGECEVYVTDWRTRASDYELIATCTESGAPVVARRVSDGRMWRTMTTREADQQVREYVRQTTANAEYNRECGGCASYTMSEHVRVCADILHEIGASAATDPRIACTLVLSFLAALDLLPDALLSATGGDGMYTLLMELMTDAVGYAQFNMAVVPQIVVSFTARSSGAMTV